MFVNKSGPTVCIDKKQEAQYLYSSHTYLITPPINTRYPTRYPIAFRRQVFALRKTREVQVQVQRFHFYWKTTDSEVAHQEVEHIQYRHHKMSQPNSQILLSLIQGEDGKAWAADKNGWKEQHEDGECSVQCPQYSVWRDE